MATKTKQKRPKAIVEKIILSQEQQKKLEDYLALLQKPSLVKYYHVVTTATKRRHVMEIIGGKLCSYCYAIPSYQVSYPYQGITRVERFCQSCYDKKENREREGEESKSFIQTD